ncbi:MAG TPA: tetratricopeptide repeat protein [Pyrinomonadaceae bacterium]
MKRCPQCRRDYYDETLIYCLDDGSALLDGPSSADEALTAIHSSTAAEDPTKQFNSRVDPTPATPRNSRIAGLIGVLVVTSLAVGSYLYYGRGGVQPIESIAVMPFTNESGNPDVEYLSDGMTESLINSLSTLPNLSVKARNTVFRYKGKEIDEKTVGRELSVQAVLFGRFTQRGDDLTLSLSLVDSVSGNTLWGEQYDRKLQDLSVLRNDIARDVAQKLLTRLSNGDTTNLTKNYTANAEALRLYFHGRYLWEKRNPESITKSIDYFNQAIEKDPNFARAYSGLADAYIVPAGGFAPRAVMPKAKAAVTRALEIDNSLAEAHTSLARILQVYDWNWAEAEKEYKRALELDPRYPLAHQWYGGYLERTGRLEESIAERKVAVELDPLSPSTNFELGLAYFYSRDYDRAVEQLQKALELEKGFYSATQVLLASYALNGQNDLAIAKLQESKDGNLLGAAGYVYAMSGRKDDAARVIEELDRRSRQTYISAAAFALIYLALDDKDKAIAYLEKGFEERAFQMQFLKVDPRWDKLRDDPRFQDLLTKVGLPSN